MTLAILATEDNWQGFDEAWSELMGTEGSVDEVIAALDIVSEKRRVARCLPMLREHAGILEGKSLFAESARLLGAALRSGGPASELGAPLLEHSKAAWGDESWWEALTEISGFKPGAPDLRKAWVTFDEIRTYEVGTVIFHAAGWGTGEVTSIDRDILQAEVRFQSGREDHFPLRTAVDIFDRLPENDLRVQALRDHAALKKRIKAEPLEILRSVLQRYNGKANNITIKNALDQIGIGGSSWTAWWKKARVLAENSEWFRVSGNATRAQIELLRSAIDPVESIQRQLLHAPTLGDALTRVRDLLGGKKLDDNVQSAVLAALEEQVADKRQLLAHRMAAWMLLREHKGETPADLTALLESALGEPLPEDPSQPPALWNLLLLIPGVREQERAFELLKEVCGDAWLEQAREHFAHAPPGMIKPLIEGMLAGGAGGDLARHYGSLLARPTRAPFVLIALARLAEQGRIEGDFPSPIQRGQALIELGVQLEAGRRGDPAMSRALERLVDLLTKGKEPLLRRLLADADTPALRNVRSMLARGIDDRIDAMVTDIAIEKGPELFSPAAMPFWKESSIWTTRAGLARRDAELRELTEVKIPENSQAIARAASFGDLSENSEWENAIADQRQLTTQANAMEQELRKAALLENAPIPENTVCPGTEVHYRETATDEEQTILMLGPWDGYRDRAVSYLAPLADAMLGKHPGDTATVRLPSGPLEVQILGVKPADLA